MRSLAIFLILSPVVLTLPFPSYTTEDDFQEEEFDYFYNLELVEKLQSLGDDNKLTQADVSKIVDEVEERPERMSEEVRLAGSAPDSRLST